MAITEAKPNELDSGLRILARMIARAHLREMRGKQSEVADSQDEKKREESNVDKRRI